MATWALYWIGTEARDVSVAPVEAADATAAVGLLDRIDAQIAANIASQCEAPSHAPEHTPDSDTTGDHAP